MTTLDNLNLNLNEMTREDLESLEGFELVSEDTIIEKCHDYLDERIVYIEKSIIEMFVDDDVIRNSHMDRYKSYIEDIKWETNRDNSNRINNEMAEWGAETEEEFLDMLVKSAVDEGVSYFKDNFGDEDGIEMLINMGAIDIDGLKEYVVESDNYSDILGRDVHELELEEGTHYLIQD